MDKDIAISVKHLSKTFRIPHEKVSSVRGAFVSALTKKTGYEEFRALDDVSFEVKKGEFFGIIGRNGSGKSTLLKILAGIYQPDHGTVHINGMISPFLELGIGFNPELSGRDNIYLNATVLGMTKKQIDAKFDSIVAFSELARFIDQKLKNYSSGMQVRLAFSVSIHANRDILLMDEVLAVGDSNFQKKCLDTFKKFKKEGKTIILVTHDMGTVLNFCDRVILLNEGKNICSGESSLVLERYSTLNLGSGSDMTRSDSVKGWGSGEIIVDGIDIYEERGAQSVTVVTSGNSVMFRIRFHITAPIAEPVFGLGIHSDGDDTYLVALNSYIDRHIFGKEIYDVGFIDVEVPVFNLNQGTYYINIIVGDSVPNFNDPIFFVSRIKVFEVRSSSYNEALFRLDHTWSASGFSC